MRHDDLLTGQPNCVLEMGVREGFRVQVPYLGYWPSTARLCIECQNNVVDRHEFQYMLTLMQYSWKAANYLLQRRDMPHQANSINLIRASLSVSQDTDNIEELLAAMFGKEQLPI